MDTLKSTVRVSFLLRSVSDVRIVLASGREGRDEIQ